MDNFAVYGTQFESLEDEQNSAVSKKPTPIQEQIATDERGRRRFHGAFTGGFSAGYFNTVGTKHGWVPQTFSSSKSSRAEHQEQLAEDFMDEEDLGEFGISTRRIRTKADFADSALRLSTTDSRKRLAWEHPTITLTVHSEIDSIVRPVSDSESLGMRLLKQMGWREGKGIGALMSKRQLERQKVHEMKARGMKAEFDEDGVRLFEQMAPDFAFAPEDIPAVYFSSHDGTKGLGYRGLESSSALDQRKGHLAASLRKNNSGKGIRGQAFGIGVFEDEDEDVYTNFDMTQYDYEICNSAGPSKAPKADTTFVMAGERQNARRFYNAPKIPPGFCGQHRPFLVDVSAMPGNIKKLGEKLTAVERARYLGDRSASIMELLPDAERKRLQNQNKKPHRKSRWDVGKAEAPVEEAKTEEHAREVDENDSVQSSPFEEDPLKEHRFHQYRNYLRRGLTFPQPLDMTELEWDREVAEFQKYLSREERDLLPEVRQKQVPLAANLAFTVPLAEMLRSKFTTATHEDANSSKKGTKDGDRLAAVKSKMFGELTRQHYDWYPAKNLCKLFNVPDPYPHTFQQGVLHLQKRSAATSKRIDDIALLGVGLPNTRNELQKREAVDAVRSRATFEQPLAMKEEVLDDEQFDDEKFDNDDEEPNPSDEGPSLDLLKAIFEASDNEGEESDGERETECREHEARLSSSKPGRRRSPSPKSAQATLTERPNPGGTEKFVNVLDMRELDEEFGPLPPPVIECRSEHEQNKSTTKASKKHKNEKKHKTHKKHSKEKVEVKEGKTEKKKVVFGVDR
ncbi:hypothetical protein QR680_012881 [Steinernema hermaphroditum]|uniref:G-patch domain-containing protein n=1 Tax=Steinernema hermaphroditum TaxID=289476 RepID=A0AA39I5Y3_9BILA|nr:hypothetical protein QR680_012881 [Steinernema hermaphroditum]